MTEHPDPVRHADNESYSREYEASCAEKAEQDYIRWLLTDFTMVGRGTNYERAAYEFEDTLAEWFEDVLDKNEIRLICLSEGFEAAGKKMGESLAEYIGAISSQAVIDKRGL